MILEACQDLWCLDMFSGKRAVYNYWSQDLKVSLLEMIFLLILCQSLLYIKFTHGEFVMKLFSGDSRFSWIQSVVCSMSTHCQPAEQHQMV